MTDTALELYHGLASTCSKKVRLTLCEKGLGFKSHLLDLQKLEQHRPEYLALNPEGVVPTLVHGGRIIVESSVIIEYLDDAFPETPLRPADPAARAAMRLWLKFSDTVAYPAVSPATWMITNRNVMQDFSDTEREAALARVPSDERRRRWRAVTADGMPQADLDAARIKMLLLLWRCEDALALSPWLAGADYSLADIAIVPFVVRIRNLEPELISAHEFPRLAGWYERMRARPAFGKAIHFTDDPRAPGMINI